jgi:hypothetical protein
LTRITQIFILNSLSPLSFRKMIALGLVSWQEGGILVLRGIARMIPAVRSCEWEGYGCTGDEGRCFVTALLDIFVDFHDSFYAY